MTAAQVRQAPQLRKVWLGLLAVVIPFRNDQLPLLGRVVPGNVAPSLAALAALLVVGSVNFRRILFGGWVATE